MDAFTFGLCTAAAGLFLRGIYHSGVLTGWIVRGVRDNHCADCQDAGECLHNRRCQVPAAPKFDLEAHERHLAEGAPLAFWLDYARTPARQKGCIDAIKEVEAEAVLRQHGIMVPRQTFRAVTKEPVYLTLRCPNCGTYENSEVTATHGGEASAWWCKPCDLYYTSKGETKQSRRDRFVRERNARDREAARLLAEKAKRLPCGCTGEVRTRSYPTGGWDMGRYAVCETCGGCWDYAPKYGDTGNPRKQVRGEVEWPNGDHRLDMPPPPAIN